MLLTHPETKVTTQVYTMEEADRLINRGYQDAYKFDAQTDKSPFTLDIQGKHKGEPIYVVGGAPSLSGFDFNRLKGKVVIACNKAIVDLPFAPYMVYMDDQFYGWHKEEVDAFKGVKITHKWNKEREGVHRVKNLGQIGLSDNINDGLYNGGNAGYLALSLAYILGGDPIYLLGIDMCYGDNGSTHYHDGYPKEDKIQEVRFIHMKAAFLFGAVYLKQRGVRAYNCSKISKLKASYEYKDIDEVL